MSGQEKWIVIGTVGVSGIAAAGYVVYKYFVGPSNAILGQYKLLLEDIYKETKDFITDNSKLSPPIIGLQPWQEILLEEKKKLLKDLEPRVIRVLENSRIDPQAWFQQLFIMIAEVAVAAVAVAAIIQLIRAWWARPVSQNLQGAESHSNLMYEMCTREFAALGQLNLAGGLQTSIQTMYSAYSEANLISAATEYTSILSTLIPGTLDYLVYTQLLTYVQTEISATSGIAAQMYPFWAPF